MRYLRGAGQIYSQNVLFHCPPTATISVLSVWLSWLFSPMARQGWAFLFSLSGAHSSEPAFCICWPSSVSLPHPSAPLSSSFSFVLGVVFPLFSLSFQQWGLEVPAEERSRLSHKPFPFQYQQHSRGGKSLPRGSRFPLVTYWNWASKAQPLRGPWLIRAGIASEHPRGCCSQELGSLSPSVASAFNRRLGH